MDFAAKPGTDDAELRDRIVATYRQITDGGLMKSTSGNISCRRGDGMLITPGRASADNLTPERVVAMDFDGKSEGPLKPSSEWPMHALIYRRVPGANAVVHTHSDYCVALSCCNMPIPAYHYMVAAFGGDDIPCVPYATFGSPELARNAAAGLQNRSACLLGNHGMICHGPTLDKAASLAQLLEIIAHQYVLSLQAGRPVILDSEEVQKIGGRMRNYFG